MVCKTTWTRAQKQVTIFKMQLLTSSRLHSVLGIADCSSVIKIHPIMLSSVFILTCECHCFVFIVDSNKATDPHLL